MVRVEVTAPAVGYPDGVTRTEYEPGFHELPADLAGAFVVMGVAEYAPAPKPEPATAPKPATEPADDGAGAAAQPKAARTPRPKK